MDLPPAIFVPTSLIYHPAMSPAMLATWIKLRSLACTDDETPPLSIPKLVAITGRRPSSLYKYLAFLRAQGALTCRSCGKGAFIVSFKSDGSAASLPESAILDLSQSESDSKYLESDSIILENDPRNLEMDSINLEDISKNLESDSKKLEFDSRNLEKDSINLKDDSKNLENDSKNLENDSKNLENRSNNLEIDSKNLEMPPPSDPPSIFSSFFYSKINHTQEEDQLKREGKFQNPGTGSGKINPRLADPEIAAVNQYRQHTGLRPNRLQRQLLRDQISDLQVWGATLEHWLAHGWNPKNITGQLELYQRGGPHACRYCRKEEPPEGSTYQIIQHMLSETNDYPQ